MSVLFHVRTDRVELTISDSGRGASSRGRDNSTLTPELRFRALRGDLAILDGSHAGAPNASPIDPSSLLPPRLFEETNYLINIEGAAEPVDVAHRDPNFLAGLGTGGNGRLRFGTINFGSQVGLTSLVVTVGGVPEFELQLEVLPTKIEYREDYAAMMSEVQDLAAGLVLEFLRATHQLGTTVAEQIPTKLDWVLVLRHVIDGLTRALEHVARRPVRGVCRDEHLVRADALRRVDSATRSSIRRGRGSGERILLASGVAVRERLPERRPQPTLDTMEHRWLVEQVRQVRRRLAEVILEERSRDEPRSRVPTERTRTILAELAEMESRVSRLEGLEPLAAAQGLPPAMFTSLLLQGAPGYREAYQALIVLRQGLRIQGDAVEVSLKDVHLLYEYWCYLGIVQAVARIVDAPIPAEQLLEVRADGVRVTLQKGRRQVVRFALPGDRSIEVVYNPRFGGSLLPQQPDIALSLHDRHWPSVKLVLDAKYRIADDPESLKRFGAPGPPQDAINVLHRYRDAITEVRARGDRRARHRVVVEGAALFPLSASSAARFDKSRYWKYLEELGIGAVPFLPGSTSWLEQWLRGVLRRSGWRVADAVVPHAAEVRESGWKRLAHEPALIGVLRADNPEEHLEWIRERRAYYAPLVQYQPRQLRTTHVAVFEPSVRGAELGRVQWWADVERIEVVRRSEVKTPWRPRRDDASLVVVYHLGELERLEHPLLNAGGRRAQRFSSNRWSSVLALRRASTIEELLLESLAEWKVRDELAAAGIVAEIRAAKRPGANVGSEGRAAFVTELGTVRVVSSREIRIERDGESESVPLEMIVEALQAPR